MILSILIQIIIFCFSSVPIDHDKCDREKDKNSNHQNNNNNIKQTFSIDDILRPKALKLHPGFVTSTSPSSSNTHGNMVGFQDRHYRLDIDNYGNPDYHGNRGTIHTRAGSVPKQHSFTAVIKEHIHRQGVEPSVHHKDSPFYLFSSYGPESKSKDRDIYHKGPGFPQSGARISDKFRWDDNVLKGREGVPIPKEQSSHRDEGREAQGQERESPGRRSPSPVESASSCGSASEAGERERRVSVSSPPSSQYNSHSVITPHAEHEGTSPHTAHCHVSSPSEVEYLSLPAMPHPTYPAPHHMPPQPLPGVCLPLPQVCYHTQSKTKSLT